MYGLIGMVDAVVDGSGRVLSSLFASFGDMLVAKRRRSLVAIVCNIFKSVRKIRRCKIEAPHG